MVEKKRVTKKCCLPLGVSRLAEPSVLMRGSSLAADGKSAFFSRSNRTRSLECRARANTCNAPAPLYLCLIASILKAFACLKLVCQLNSQAYCSENRKKTLTIFEVTIFCSSHARPISTFGILHSGARKAFRKQSNQACYNIQNKKVIFLILKKYDVHTVLARLLTQRDPLLSTPHPNMNHNKPYHPFFASCEI